MAYTSYQTGRTFDGDTPETIWHFILQLGTHEACMDFVARHPAVDPRRFIPAPVCRADEFLGRLDPATTYVVPLSGAYEDGDEWEVLAKSRGFAVLTGDYGALYA